MSERYYVITVHDTDINWEETERSCKLHIKNREFPTLKAAREYRDTIHPSWNPRVAMEVE